MFHRPSSALPVLLGAGFTCLFAAGAGLRTHARPAVKPRTAASCCPAEPKAQSFHRSLSFEPFADGRSGKYIARSRGFALQVASNEAVLRLTGAGATQAIPPPERRAGILRGLPESALTRLRVGKEPRQAVSARRAVTSTVRMRLIGANAAAPARPERPMPGKVNYLRGSDPGAWLVGVPTFERVRYEEVYPGIDLAYYGTETGADAKAPARRSQLEYDFIVAPGASTEQIRLTFGGAESLRLSPEGDLLVNTPAGQVRQHRPTVYQEINGRRRAVQGRYALKARQQGPQQVCFEIGSYDERRPLVIDPTVEYSTFLGGSGNESSLGVDTDEAGNAYVLGLTTSANFPTHEAADTTLGGMVDYFVTKYSPAGEVLYSTYLGGTSDDGYRGSIAVDAAGNAYVGGETSSDDYPTTAGAFQGPRSGDDGVVSKLSPTGTLVYSTYLGGDSYDTVEGIAVTPEGNAVVTGQSSSEDFPTTPGTFQPERPEDGFQFDAFVTKLNTGGTGLVFSTYLAGATDDSEGVGVAFDSFGNIAVTGNVRASDFPLKDPYQSTHGGGLIDTFLTKLTSDGSALVYSTYLGGDGIDLAYGIDSDARVFPTPGPGPQVVITPGSVFVSGEVTGTLPTINGFDHTLGGANDGYFGFFGPNGQPQTVTYLGGGEGEYAFDVARVGDTVWVGGNTASPADFPFARGPLPPFGSFAGGADGFVAGFNPAQPAAAPFFAVPLGGQDNDRIASLCPSGVDGLVCIGDTASPDLPVKDPAQPAHGGGTNAFPTDSFVVNISDARDCPMPNDPTNLHTVPIVGSGASVDLRWDYEAPPEVVDYVIERVLEEGGRQEVGVVREGGRRSLTITPPAKGARYRVIARNACGEGISDYLKVCLTPNAPTDVVLGEGSEPELVKLGWKRGAVPPPVEKFRIERRKPDGTFAQAHQTLAQDNQTDYEAQVDGPPSGGSVVYRIFAVNACGDSPPSREVEIIDNPTPLVKFVKAKPKKVKGGESAKGEVKTDTKVAEKEKVQLKVQPGPGTKSEGVAAEALPVTVPPTVTIKAGKDTGAFTITTKKVKKTTTVYIVATMNGKSKKLLFTVLK
jgi:hypothetical protein